MCLRIHRQFVVVLIVNSVHSGSTGFSRTAVLLTVRILLQLWFEYPSNCTGQTPALRIQNGVNKTRELTEAEFAHKSGTSYNPLCVLELKNVRADKLRFSLPLVRKYYTVVLLIRNGKYIVKTNCGTLLSHTFVIACSGICNFLTCHHLPGHTKQISGL